MRRSASPVLLVAALLLAGCASDGAVSATPGPSASQPAPTAGETPLQTPAAADLLVVGVDGIIFSDDGTSRSYPFAEPEQLLQLVETLTDQPRSGEDFEDPWGGGEVMGTVYRWDEISVSVSKDGAASVSVVAPRVGGIPLQTSDGIAVGATRAAATAAGAWEEWDADGDGHADHLGIDEQESPGTTSLSRPGEVGRVYISLALDGDVVTELHAPANDFSDL
ncbi:hypothetical protein [Microbacterium hibisci]|uniref:hypothetical protein n=1 Tax=Microbacterium hibisci TaxID=2036000 RepID=UPI0019440915|nr:hypothetical protein [Microbacterium hibisci]